MCASVPDGDSLALASWAAIGPRKSTICELNCKGSAPINWDRVEGNWKQLTGKVKEQWGKLTDDDITQINGNREQLEGKLQARYGYAKDQVRKDIDDWLRRQWRRELQAMAAPFNGAASYYTPDLPV